jgi:hypothetical protein
MPSHRRLAAALALTTLVGCPTPVSTTDGGPRPDAFTLVDAEGTDGGPRADVGPLPDTGPEVILPPDDPGPSDVRFDVSSVRDRHAISPWIYGSNQADAADLHGETIARLGGNRWTAYNWETNASNAGSDYLYQNDTFLGGGTEPGGAVRGAVEAFHAAGLGALITIPIAGFVAADTSGPTDSGGADRATRFFPTEPTSGGALGGAPDLGDGHVYADEYADWARRTLMPGGPVLFSLDNEPDLWSSTHSEIHPDALTYAEIEARNVDFATAITAAVPDAVVLGPVSYGYAGYLNLQSAPDAGGRNFLDHYLEAMSAAETTAGRRLVHALDVHWYPEAQGGGMRIVGDDTSDASAEARMQAPRSLWDPTYVETSWITDCCTSGGAIRLLPWIEDMIDARYPGTRIAMTEYDYGGGGHISGGVAQADVLGIFGREDLFAAMWWQLSDQRAFVDAAFEMYRDFDGAGAAFGDTSIAASSDDVATSSVYASVDAASSGRMVIVAINRSASSVTAGVSIEHTQRFGTARVFRLAGTTASPTPDGTIAITLTNAFTVDLPARSVTTLELVP